MVAGLAEERPPCSRPLRHSGADRVGEALRRPPKGGSPGRNGTRGVEGAAKKKCKRSHPRPGRPEEKNERKRRTEMTEKVPEEGNPENTLSLCRQIRTVSKTPRERRSVSG